MNTPELYTMYQGALTSLRELRAKAGLTDAELKDSPELRADAERFSRKLAYAPDDATVEIDLLADHAGAQAFWFLVNAHWERMELMLLPPAFELLPAPMPFAVLALCFSSMLASDPPQAEVAESVEGEPAAGTFQEQGASGSDALRLSPVVGKGQAGAVWEFTDVY